MTLKKDLACTILSLNLVYFLHFGQLWVALNSIAKQIQTSQVEYIHVKIGRHIV